MVPFLTLRHVPLRLLTLLLNNLSDLFRVGDAFRVSPSLFS